MCVRRLGDGREADPHTLSSHRLVPCSISALPSTLAFLCRLSAVLLPIPSMDQQQASQSVSSDAQQSANQHVPSQTKPRARLGPTEVVQLPASDSEPDDDDRDNQEIDAGRDGDPDFLKDYPEDTEVGSAFVAYEHVSDVDGDIGASTLASPLENTSTRTSQLP